MLTELEHRCFSPDVLGQSHTFLHPGEGKGTKCFIKDCAQRWASREEVKHMRILLSSAPLLSQNHQQGRVVPSASRGDLIQHDYLLLLHHRPEKKNLINCEKHLCVSEENAKDRALPSNKKQYRSFTIYQLLKAMTIKQKYFLEALYKQLCVRGHSIEAKTAILHHIHWRTTGCLQVLLKMQKHQQQLQKGSHYAGRHPQEQVLLLYRVTWKNTSRKILR